MVTILFIFASVLLNVLLSLVNISAGSEGFIDYAAFRGSSMVL